MADGFGGVFGRRRQIDLHSPTHPPNCDGQLASFWRTCADEIADCVKTVKVVRKGGFEPPRYCYRQPLKLVRLPIPPLPRGWASGLSCRWCSQPVSRSDIYEPSVYSTDPDDHNDVAPYGRTTSAPAIDVFQPIVCERKAPSLYRKL